MFCLVYPEIAALNRVFTVHIRRCNINLMFSDCLLRVLYGQTNHLERNHPWSLKTNHWMCTVNNVGLNHSKHLWTTIFLTILPSLVSESIWIDPWKVVSCCPSQLLGTAKIHLDQSWSKRPTWCSCVGFYLNSREFIKCGMQVSFWAVCMEFYFKASWPRRS